MQGFCGLRNRKSQAGVSKKRKIQPNEEAAEDSDAQERPGPAGRAWWAVSLLLNLVTSQL